MAAAAGLAIGCGRAPDPNDPRESATGAAETMQRNLKWASDAANRRVANGEISGRMAHELIRNYAAKFAETINPADIDDQNAWRYGEIYRAAEWWKQAKPTLKRAASFAEKSGDTDRWVNDVLRYAQCCACLGEFDDATRATRFAFKAPPKDKAAILYATLYEIAPYLLGKSRDVEVAGLVEDAVAQHNLVIVDMKTDAGIAFYAAKPHHLFAAQSFVIGVYRRLGRTDLMRKAMARFNASGRQTI